MNKSSTEPEIKTSNKLKVNVFKKTSKGILLTKQRLEILSKILNEETSFNFIDQKDNSGKPKGTDVIIKIPKTKKLF